MGDAAVLARVDALRSLSLDECRRLAARCAVRRLAPGEVLFHEGQPCRGLFVIAEGRVEVGRVSDAGREQILHGEGPGAALGEGPLFDGGGYIASAIATAPTRVLFLPRAEVVALCRRHPAVALAVLATMARRLRAFAGIASDLAFHPVAVRLARLLAEAAPGPGDQGEVALTQSQLAARLGTVREIVARALAQLEARGIITRARGRVAIRDRRRLRALGADRAGATGVT